MAGRKRIGVLALQGAFIEHQDALTRLGCEVVKARTPQDISSIDGLIIPGGESTTIGRLLVDYKLGDIIKDRAEAGMPVFGTCAGMVILAKEIIGSNQYRLGLVDMEVRRNGFGRQVESFEAPLAVRGFDNQVWGIFIRAPYVERVWGEAEAMAEFDGKIVMVRQGHLLATAFHPELTEGLDLHEYFLSLV